MAEDDTVIRIRAISARIIDGPGVIRSDWIKDHGYVIAPVETAKHFDDMDCQRIAQASAYLGCDKVWAVAAKPLENIPLTFAVPMTPSGLQEFSREYGSFAFALIPDRGHFAITCHYTCYFLVAGPLAFVECALGTRIDDALDRFRAYAREEMTEYRDGLVNLLEECRNTYRGLPT